MKRFFKDNKGASAIEYALIASLLSIVIITAVTMLGNNLNTTYSQVGSSLEPKP